jgi:hypothetical protein
MGSPGAWCSVASPVATPPNAPHDGAARHRRRRAEPMTAPVATHATAVEVSGPAEVSVGADFVLPVRVSCPAGCDLSGVAVEVTAPDGATAIIATAHGGADIAARDIALKAPLRVGDHVWRLACAAHETDGVHHEARAVPVTVRTRPHETSLAVWAIPSPVVIGQPFAIKVGAKSTTGADLKSMRIAVCDEAGDVLAGGALGDTPWPGTSALYWTELALAAPDEAGIFTWSVNFDAAELALPHHGSSSRFSIAIVSPPQHRLIVKVVEQDTAKPIENAQVRLGAYRAATSVSGIAELMMPNGSFDLNVWKSGYEAPTTTIAIEADVTIEITVAAVPEENPDAAWQM